MRRLLASVLALAASSAWADVDVSFLVAGQGLRGAEATLAALPSPTPSESFALGGVRFLEGVERALQLRYRVGLSEGLAVASSLPVLRLPLGENPSPDPFEPGMIEALFEDVRADMAGSLEALALVGDDDAVSVRIDLDDLWFDIDMDGAHGPGEGVMEVAGTTLGVGFDVEAEPGKMPPGPSIRFDTADAAWLAAYAHLLAGVSEGMLALRPTEAIGRVLDARTVLAALPRDPDPYGMSLNEEWGDAADLLAIAVFALEGRPDAERTRALRGQLLATVAENRRFWTLVAREADNDAEWIPSKRQTSATGLPFPPETGLRWLAVLADAEAVLRGEQLLGHWRMGRATGIDLAALLEDPPALNVAGLIQGGSLLPYARRGRLVDGESLALFWDLVQGRAGLYAMVLN